MKAQGMVRTFSSDGVVVMAEFWNNSPAPTDATLGPRYTRVGSIDWDNPGSYVLHVYPNAEWTAVGDSDDLMFEIKCGLPQGEPTEYDWDPRGE